MINSPPEVVGFSPNLDEHLVQMTLPLRPCTKVLGSFPSDLGREDRTKAVPPEPARTGRGDQRPQIRTHRLSEQK